MLLIGRLLIDYGRYSNLMFCFNFVVLDTAEITLLFYSISGKLN